LNSSNKREEVEHPAKETQKKEEEKGKRKKAQRRKEERVTRTNRGQL